jgi:hypothetical protein
MIRNIFSKSSRQRPKHDLSLQKQLCFVLYEENEAGCNVLKIWDKNVEEKLVFDTKEEEEKQTIGSLCGWKMRFEESKIPFTRVLSLHAQCSYETAKKMKWRNEDEPKPVEYGSPVGIISFRDTDWQS